MTSPPHITFAVAGRIYRLDLVRGVARASGGLFRESISLDDLSELLLVLDEAAEELRRRLGNDVGPGRAGGAQ